LHDHAVQTRIEKTYSARLVEKKLYIKIPISAVFSGIMAGDGDIGSRMASSHPGAKPPYPPPIDSYVENLYKDLRQGKFNHLTSAQIKALATELADRVVKIMG
jgi:hypothetical protein